VPARRTAASICASSSSVRATGFSISTALPWRAARPACSTWNAWGVQTKTASTLASAQAAS